MNRIVLIIAVLISLVALPILAEQPTRADQIADGKAALATLREEPSSADACACRERWQSLQALYAESYYDKSYLSAIGTNKRELDAIKKKEAPELFVATWTAANTDPASLQCFAPAWHWVTMQEGGFYALDEALDAIEDVGISPSALGVDAWSYRAALVREMQKSAAEAVSRVTAAERSYAESHAICYVCHTLQKWEKRDVPLGSAYNSIAQLCFFPQPAD